jgi:hypothetical protein
MSPSGVNRHTAMKGGLKSAGGDGNVLAKCNEVTEVEGGDHGCAWTCEADAPCPVTDGTGLKVIVPHADSMNATQNIMTRLQET